VTPGRAGIEIKMEDLGVSGSLGVYCKGATGVTRDGVVLRAGADYPYEEKQQKLALPFHSASASSSMAPPACLIPGFPARVATNAIAPESVPKNAWERANQ
jgi:hypothetical protein